MTVITLNIYVLNALIKRQNWYPAFKRLTLGLKTQSDWKREDGGGMEQDGRGVRGCAHLLPQIHQKNTSMCKMTLTEHQLNAGRRT